MSQTYDIAVIGAGVFGTWTALALSQNRLRVALVDAFGAGNNRSSSGDESRIIRMSYGASELYSRWSWQSLGLWQKLGEETGQKLFHQTGVLFLARGDNAHALDSLKVLASLQIPFEKLERDQLEALYPQFAFSEAEWAVYEPLSGALMARRAVQTVADLAQQRGVIWLDAAIQPPVGQGHLPGITAQDGTQIQAGQFIFACGAWLPKLFPALLGQRIHPTRQEVFYFGRPGGDKLFTAPRCPVWIDFEAGFYGFPDLEARGFKVAPDRHGEDFDPDTSSRDYTPARLGEVRAFLAHRFPVLRDAPVAESRVCQYENTCNGDFLIDRHPDFANVWLVGGGSGHGFKHGPALGEYVAARVMANDAVEPEFSLASKATVRARAIY